MKIKITSLFLVLTFVVSLFSVNVFARENLSEKVSLENFSYVETDETIRSEATLERNYGFDKELPYLFSIIIFDGGKIVEFDATEGVLSENTDSALIRTPDVNYPESATDLRIVSMVTSPEFSALLSPVANYNSSSCEVVGITIGGFEVPLEEGKTEYALTLFADEDKFPLDVDVETRDMATRVEVSDIDSNHTTVYITVTSADETKTVEYVINLDAYSMNDSSITGIDYTYSYGSGEDIVTVSGICSDFNPDDRTFYIDIAETEDIIPQVNTELFDAESEITITQPDSFPGNAYITVTGEENTTDYVVKFRKLVTESLPVKDFITYRGTYTAESAYLRLQAKDADTCAENRKNNNMCAGYTLFCDTTETEDGILKELISASMVNEIKSSGYGTLPASFSVYAYGDDDTDDYVYFDETKGDYTFTSDVKNSGLKLFSGFKGVYDSDDTYLLGISPEITTPNQKFVTPLDLSKLQFTENNNLMLVVRKNRDDQKVTIIYPVSVELHYSLELE